MRGDHRLFPEDRCKLHVLAWNLTEVAHQDIARLRGNVYELVAYLRGANVAHGLAHPLCGPNRRFTPDHFERCLLLFSVFELNGARDKRDERRAAPDPGRPDPGRPALPGQPHDFSPLAPVTAPRGLCAGSDDHSA